MVVEYLTARGREQERLTPRGFAYDRPVASNSTDDGRQKNRRVEVHIAPNEELLERDAKAAARDDEMNRRASAASTTR